MLERFRKDKGKEKLLKQVARALESGVLTPADLDAVKNRQRGTHAGAMEAVMTDDERWDRYSQEMRSINDRRYYRGDNVRDSKARQSHKDLAEVIKDLTTELGGHVNFIHDSDPHICFVDGIDEPQGPNDYSVFFFPSSWTNDQVDEYLLRWPKLAGEIRKFAQSYGVSNEKKVRDGTLFFRHDRADEIWSFSSCYIDEELMRVQHPLVSVEHMEKLVAAIKETIMPLLIEKDGQPSGVEISLSIENETAKVNNDRVAPVNISVDARQSVDKVIAFLIEQTEVANRLWLVEKRKMIEAKKRA